MRYVLKFRTTTNPDETLAHHGIKGQKWGVRRFQDEDGHLTPAGKKRYSDDDGDESNTGLVPYKSKTDTDDSSKTTEKAYDPDEIFDAPKKDSESETGNKKKSTVYLDDDDFNIYDDTTKSSKSKTKDTKNGDSASKAPKIDEAVLREAIDEGREKRNKRINENLKNASDISKTAGKLSTDLGNAYDSIVKVNVPRMDLNHMSNKEMQDRIQREALERQYDQMFNVDRQRVQAGKDRVVNTLKTVGTIVTVGSVALDLALKIRKARGG